MPPNTRKNKLEQAIREMQENNENPELIKEYKRQLKEVKKEIQEDKIKTEKIREALMGEKRRQKNERK